MLALLLQNFPYRILHDTFYSANNTEKDAMPRFLHHIAHFFQVVLNVRLYQMALINRQ